MLKYSLKRILQSALTLFIVVTVVFLLMRLMPEEGYFGVGSDKLDHVQKENILRSYGLRDPMHIQLKNFYIRLLRGDMGTSIIYRPKVPVSVILKGKVYYSLYLGLASIGVSLVFGIGLGILMSQYKGKLWDKLGTVYIVVINAVPAAVYYLFIQLYTTEWFKLPILFDVDKPVSWILPIVSMSLGSMAGYAMWMRRYMVDELNKDYIRLARAKGLKNSAVMVRHVMRNAFVPMAQYLPTSILLTIAGSLYIEYLYSIPGMGGLLIDAIQRQDNPLVQALVLIYSAVSIIGLFMGDLLMALCDPRIKLEHQGGSR
ncbi:MAG: peptide ABC transporter permease [Clostridia bacterium BRH_c25]|nr:MAG: peptide ABC transporter permease [Clostridia bacterium BRH_c25]